MQELFNLRWYIQHHIDESEDEIENLLCEENWILQTNWKFIKYVAFTIETMAPEQLNINPIKPIIKVNANQELDANEGESTKDEEEPTTSTEL